jgi:hypothetical protein
MTPVAHKASLDALSLAAAPAAVAVPTAAASGQGSAAEALPGSPWGEVQDIGGGLQKG